MAKKGLTAKQRIFCEEYILDWNASRAARVAGYSPKTAPFIGAENLKKPQIAAYIEEIQKDISKLAGVSALRNAKELAKIAYANFTDYKDGWMTLKEFESISDDQKAAISEIQYTTRTFDGGSEEIVKFKLHNKQHAIEALNKMFGINAPEKSEIEITEILTEGDRLKRLAALKDKMGK